MHSTSTTRRAPPGYPACHDIEPRLTLRIGRIRTVAGVAPIDQGLRVAANDLHADLALTLVKISIFSKPQRDVERSYSVDQGPSIKAGR
jgi:hypothetical protein